MCADPYMDMRIDMRINMCTDMCTTRAEIKHALSGSALVHPCNTNVRCSPWAILAHKCVYVCAVCAVHACV